jgi:hypothetical protein
VLWRLGRKDAARTPETINNAVNVTVMIAKTAFIHEGTCKLSIHARGFGLSPELPKL